MNCQKTYSYPAKGGLGGLWRALCKTLPKNNARFKSKIAQLDVEEKKLITKEGLEIRYEQMLSCMALPTLLELCGRADLAQPLEHSSLYAICLGVRGMTHHKDITGCIFFPESGTIFHRACIFSNLDNDSVPADDVTIPTLRLASQKSRDGVGEMKTGPYWSLLCEVSDGALKSVDDNTVVDDVVKDACAVGLLHDDDEIVSMHLTEIRHGYPLPTIASAHKVDGALAWLQSKDIWSRGRFGAFKYELGEIDCCFIQGVEAADNMLHKAPERCLYEPYDITSPTKIPYPCFDIPPTEGASITFSEGNDTVSDVNSSTLSCDITASFSSSSTPSEGDDGRNDQ